MKDLIRKILKEEINGTKIVCDDCGWSWKLKDGGKDPYTCHKCGKDNSPKPSNFDKVLNKFKEHLPDEYKEKVNQIKKIVENYIRKSGYNVKFLNACPAYSGVRTKDQIIICAPALMGTLGDFIYTVFHEIRHEQQISDIKMPNPLSEFDLKDFEAIYKQYWEMELDADQFAKNMVASIVKSLNIPMEIAIQNFKLSPFIKDYPQASSFVKMSLQNIIGTIKEMKKKGLEYSDIQDHPMVKPYLEKLENFLD